MEGEVLLSRRGSIYNTEAGPEEHDGKTELSPEGPGPATGEAGAPHPGSWAALPWRAAESILQIVGQGGMAGGL